MMPTDPAKLKAKPVTLRLCRALCGINRNSLAATCDIPRNLLDRPNEPRGVVDRRTMISVIFQPQAAMGRGEMG